MGCAPGWVELLRLSAPPTSTGDGTTDPRTLTPEQIQGCLDRTGSVDNAWRALGLRNRFQLQRLIKKHGLVTRTRSASH